MKRLVICMNSGDHLYFYSGNDSEQSPSEEVLVRIHNDINSLIRHGNCGVVVILSHDVQYDINTKFIEYIRWETVSEED